MIWSGNRHYLSFTGPLLYFIFSHIKLFFKLLHLAGLIHHLAVNHRLRNHFHNLPGPYIWFFCNTLKSTIVTRSDTYKKKIFFLYQILCNSLFYMNMRYSTRSHSSQFLLSFAAFGCRSTLTDSDFKDSNKYPFNTWLWCEKCREINSFVFVLLT